MKEFVKKIYRAKIHFVFYFNMGYGEFGTPIAVIRDIGITLGLLKILFKVSFSYTVDILICVVAFLIFYGIGRALKASGMTQFANNLSNQVNPLTQEILIVREIAKHLGIELKDNDLLDKAKIN